MVLTLPATTCCIQVSATPKTLLKLECPTMNLIAPRGAQPTQGQC